MSDAYGTLPDMLCCVCGVDIKPNPANMCASCMQNEVDITDGLPTQLTIHSCRSCKRFLLPPWREVQLESKELMAACLRKLPGLSKMKLVDAVWIWTEPHSMRLKIKLTIQREVLNGAIMQQATVVEYTIRNQQCEHCQKSYAQGAWQAIVQVRQRVAHKRTFYYLEQLLLKHRAHADAVKIMTFRDGIDFYFLTKQHALRFVTFLEGHVPMQSEYSRKLIGADKKSNIGNYKHNYLVLIAPICKDDLVVLPRPLAASLSNISPLVLIKTVGSGIHVIDPATAERHEINTEKYFRYKFPAVMHSRLLIRFTVLQVEPIIAASRPSAKKRRVEKHSLAEVTVARERDLGVNDTQFIVVSHLGAILKEGDTVLGYDLTTVTWIDDEEMSKQLKFDMPDIVLVRKFYTRHEDRHWTLRQLDYDEEQAGAPTNQSSGRDKESEEKDYEEFLQQVETDKEMRSQINIYRNKGRTAVPQDESASIKDDEYIQLEELLDEMVVADNSNRFTVLDDDTTEEKEAFDASSFVLSEFKFL